MHSLLIVTRYKTRYIPIAFISMAIFHIPLFFNKKIHFYKLMGCGKNGTFDIHPDFNQWALMFFYDAPEVKGTAENIIPINLVGGFISGWWRVFKVKTNMFLLEPYAGHGSWDGREFVSGHKGIEDPLGEIGVLTRATIKLSRLRSFWRAVPAAAENLSETEGLNYSVGIGEVPFIKQATFSIWENAESMKNYAYKMRAHQEVIRKTRKEGWYSEEMFLRFKIIKKIINF
jgi:hypothetical protein